MENESATVDKARNRKELAGGMKEMGLVSRRATRNVDERMPLPIYPSNGEMGYPQLHQEQMKGVPQLRPPEESRDPRAPPANRPGCLAASGPMH